jgi:MFS family permease
VLALATMLYSIDLTLLHLAVPSLTADLQPSSAQLLWIVDIYVFLLAGSLITMGTLGDWIGRRRLLLIGAATFGVASVLAAFVPPEQATAARDTLGGALAARDELPAPLADELLATARDAFNLGIQVTALTSAVIAAGTAVLVVAFLRHVQAGSEEARPREVEPGISPVPAAELE